ncbi:MerR family transcriptional regulator [Sandaracinus amylolyticus]|uniref:MerR family transcriptional regulator n=1 Tax=Sandaracinus amylolyticus TaxID=927083 RepID=UPI001F484039|nr:MerR family transcriptional regulator [Sandaracinus amylolyticus]UJR79826.1 HTH-type transcriptional activator TipA [Sandaracinus amylolyticus]
MSERWSIGRFARATRLTIKALRHYDEIGLLRPAAIDRRTGYRSYAPAQVRDAVTISTLRALGVPLASIAKVLRDPRARQATLEAEKVRIEREIAEKKRALLGLERVTRAGPIAEHEVAVRTEPARCVAIVRATTSAEDLEADTTRLIREALASVPGARDPVMAILHASIDDATIPIEIAVSVDDGITMPEVRCAFVRHVGPYSELALAHDALWSWADANGIESGAIREIYVNDPDEVAEGDLVTDVLLPLA